MDTITALLLYFIFPVWTVVGVGDYLSHRATRIERTSGVGESAFHLVQLVQVGLPLLAALLLDLTASVLLLIAVAAILHTFTAWWDVAYSEQNRRITPFEQVIHCFLIVLPITAAALLIARHWEAFSAIWTEAPANWSLAWKPDPVPPRYLAAVLLTQTVFGAVPAAEEFVRCWRARASGKRSGPSYVPNPQPEAPARH